MNFRTWWMVWGDLVRKLVALASSFASMVGLVVTFLPASKQWPWWVVPLLALAIAGFAVLVFLEFSSRGCRRVYSKGDTKGIRRYMHEWIKHGGRVAIWTRDLSWAQNTETRRLLSEKAQNNELVLCLPEINELASALMKDGAEVCTYGSKLLESPASRFTITFLGRDGSRVAVGRAQGDTHMIDEFNSGDHPAFHLAADLVTLVRGLRQGRNR